LSTSSKLGKQVIDLTEPLSVDVETVAEFQSGAICRAPLARNTVFNVVGQLAPMLVSIATIPFIVRGLGPERFGILSVAWLLLGYFNFLDLGLGRAATKFIAESLAHKQSEKLPGLVWTCVGLQVVFGCVGGLLLALVVPRLVTSILKVPFALQAETRTTLLLLAASLPFVLATNGFRAVLEAAQRFDLVNFLRIPASISVYFLPVVGLWLGLHLPGIVLLLIVARLVVSLAHMACCFFAIPGLRRGRFTWGETAVAPLLRYGGWVTVANVVNPLLLYLDRFLVGSLLSLSLLGYYTIPLEAVGRLLIVPASLAATLFPVFSVLGSTRDLQRITKLYSRSFKYLLLVLAPPVFLLTVFAREILVLWVGTPFAAQTTRILQVLACGVLINSFAHIPFGLLQSLGRPDVAAKVLLLELPLYVPFGWFMISRYGIQGAAVGWTIRVTIEAAAFTIVVFHLFSLDRRAFIEPGLLRSLVVTLILAGTLLAASLLLGDSLPLRLFACISLTIVFAWLVWRKILDSADRQQVQGMFPSFFKTSKALTPA
jgi:O-antigen/teichoic acid export membrane protein